MALHPLPVCKETSTHLMHYVARYTIKQIGIIQYYVADACASRFYLYAGFSLPLLFSNILASCAPLFIPEPSHQDHAPRNAQRAIDGSAYDLISFLWAIKHLISDD